MHEFKYTDRRGLEIHPDEIDRIFTVAGLHRKAFEGAAKAGLLEPWQALGFIEVYGRAIEWYARNSNDTRPDEWIMLDGFTRVHADG